jgi:hypothetical protein
MFWLHACKKEKKSWCHPLHATCWKLKKSRNHNQTSKLNFDCTIGFLTIKTSKQDLTWLYFDKLFYSYFLIKVIYSVRTKRIKCQNKREQLSEQVYMSSRTTNVVSNQIRTRVRTCYYYSQNKILV